MKVIELAKAASWLGVVLILISMVVALVSVVFHMNILDVANLLAVLAGVFIACGQLALFRVQLVDEHQRRRIERSLSYSIINSEHLLEVRKYLESLFPNEMQDVTSIPLEKLGVAQQDQRMSGAEKFEPIMLKHLLAHWGNLAVTIYTGATDEQVAFELIGSLLVEHVIIFTHYLQYSQRRDPRTYLYLTHLAKRWHQRLNNTEAIPAFVKQEERIGFVARMAFLQSLERQQADSDA